MKVCLVCLKTFQGFTSSGESQVQQKCGGGASPPPLIKLLKFAETNLQVYFAATTRQLLATGECAAICENCERKIIDPIYKRYLDLVGAHDPLPSELGELGKALQDSKSFATERVRRRNMKMLANQLGISDSAQIEEFRSLLAEKCKCEPISLVNPMRILAS